MTKKSKKASINCTMEQAQEASKTYAEKTNRLEKIEATMNQELNTVKSKYSDEITVLQEEIVEPKELLEVYARTQRNTWGDKKSCELVHCKLAFRDNPPKVSKQKQFTWDAVLELLKKHKNFKQFIRVKEEINKEAILMLNCSDKKDNQLLQKLKEECYLFIDHDESFFVTPKKEKLN